MMGSFQFVFLQIPITGSRGYILEFLVRHLTDFQVYKNWRVPDDSKNQHGNTICSDDDLGIFRLPSEREHR